MQTLDCEGCGLLPVTVAQCAVKYQKRSLLLQPSSRDAVGYFLSLDKEQKDRFQWGTADASRISLYPPHVSPLSHQSHTTGPHKTKKKKWSVECQNQEREDEKRELGSICLYPLWSVVSLLKGITSGRREPRWTAQKLDLQSLTLMLLINRSRPANRASSLGLYQCVLTADHGLKCF